MDSAIVLLAGGASKRFPGKLQYPIGNQPMILRVYRRLAESGYPIAIAAKGSFAPEIDAQLYSPLIVDRAAPSGPLDALHAACAHLRYDWIFAIAADQPEMDAGVLAHLAAARREGDEAVVPSHSGRIEPLAALYSRRALLRARAQLRREGRFAMRDLVDALASRIVPMDARWFVNVNRITDLPVATNAG